MKIEYIKARLARLLQMEEQRADALKQLATHWDNQINKEQSSIAWQETISAELYTDETLRLYLFSVQVDLGTRSDLAHYVKLLPPLEIASSGFPEELAKQLPPLSELQPVYLEVVNRKSDPVSSSNVRWQLNIPVEAEHVVKVVLFNKNTAIMQTLPQQLNYNSQPLEPIKVNWEFKPDSDGEVQLYFWKKN